MEQGGQGLGHLIAMSVERWSDFLKVGDLGEMSPMGRRKLRRGSIPSGFIGKCVAADPLASLPQGPGNPSC